MELYRGRVGCRLSVVLRRGAALMLELAVFHVTVMAVLGALFGELQPSNESYSFVALLGFLVFFSARDALGGGTSPIKRMLGLRVVTRGGGQAGTWALVRRNLIWALGPLSWTLETLVAARHRQRLGDRMAGTRVVDVAPRGWWPWPAALALFVGVYGVPALSIAFVQPRVIQALQALGVG